MYSRRPREIVHHMYRCASFSLASWYFCRRTLSTIRRDENTRRWASMSARWSCDGRMFSGKCVTKLPSQYFHSRKMLRYHGTIAW